MSKAFDHLSPDVIAEMEAAETAAQSQVADLLNQLARQIGWLQCIRALSECHDAGRIRHKLLRPDTVSTITTWARSALMGEPVSDEARALREQVDAARRRALAAAADKEASDGHR